MLQNVNSRNNIQFGSQVLGHKLLKRAHGKLLEKNDLLKKKQTPKLSTGLENVLKGNSKHGSIYKLTLILKLRLF